MTDNYADPLFRFLLDEANKLFAGWDFSYVEGTGRLVIAALTWSYSRETPERLPASVHCA